MIKKGTKKPVKVVLECSPFIRVMASAAIIATELGLQQKPVTINYQYSEFQSMNDVDECPIPGLEFKTQSLDDLDKEFNLLGVKFNDT